jgi:hypothetical protein
MNTGHGAVDNRPHSVRKSMAGIAKPSLAMAAPRTHTSGQAEPAATAPIRRLHDFLLFFLCEYA